MELLKNNKIISIILFFTLFCLQSFAQHKKELSIHSGFVFSLSDLRSRPYNQDKIFSPGDWSTAARFNYQVYGNFYLGIRGNASFLKTRNDGIEEANRNFILEEWDGGRYRMFNVLAGPKYCLPLKGKLDISFALMGGIGIMKVSELGILTSTYITMLKNLERRIYKFNNSFCLEGEIECNYQLSQHLSFSINVAYFTQTFGQAAMIINSSPYFVPLGSGYSYDDKMEANMIIPSMGIKYAF